MLKGFRLTGPTKRSDAYRGFSLIEMAMVLLILGLILNGLFVSLGQSDLNRRRAQANAEMEQIRDAIYGFAQTNGRLPCPASVTSSGNEDPASVPATGVCTSYRGFVPGVRLGLQGNFNSQGLLMDPWGNPYRYIVSSALISGNAMATSVDGLRSWFSAPATNSGLCVSDTVNCGVVQLATSVPAVIYSLGADWRSFTSALQLENVGATLNGYPIDNDGQFVNAPYSEDTTLYFDDQVVWLSANILFSQMIDAGRLP